MPRGGGDNVLTLFEAGATGSLQHVGLALASMAVGIVTLFYLGLASMGKSGRRRRMLPCTSNQPAWSLSSVFTKLSRDGSCDNCVVVP